MPMENTITPQSVDINHLVQIDAFQTTIASPSPFQSLTNPFREDLTDGKLTLSGASDMASGMGFELITTENVLQLTEKKDSKSRVFILSFDKVFLQINQRRASREETRLFSSRLRVWANWLIKTDSTKHREAQGLLALSKRFLDTEHSSRMSKTDSLSEKIARLKDVILGMIPGGKKILVSNQETQQVSGTARYGFYVTPEKAVYVEKSSMVKYKVEFDFSALTILINGQSITENALDWFTRRLERLSQDLTQNRAAAYV